MTENQMQTDVGAVLLTHRVDYYYKNLDFTVPELRTAVQVAYAAHSGGNLPPFPLSKLRKTYLAAILAWLMTLNDTRYKSAGQIGDKFPKQRRPRMPLSKGGTSRKYRRQYTKNKFRNQRGMHRLQLAQAS